MVQKIDSLSPYQDINKDKDQIINSRSILKKDDFLRILMTELTHQDPLEPLKDRDFIAQMAQFSSLEQITQLSHSIEDFFSTYEKILRATQLSQATGFIGHYVKAKDLPIMVVTEEKIYPVSFEMGKDGLVTVKVYDESGDLKDTENLGYLKAGTHVFSPSNELEPGSYLVVIEAQDEDGNVQDLTVYGWDKVTEVTSEDNGVYLITDFGKKIEINNVKSIG